MWAISYNKVELKTNVSKTRCASTIRIDVRNGRKSLVCISQTMQHFFLMGVLGKRREKSN
jgi:hypothetical protein